MPLTEQLSFTFSNSTRLEIKGFWSQSTAMQNKAGVLDDGPLAGTGAGWKMSSLLRRDSKILRFGSAFQQPFTSRQQSKSSINTW
jgi:hypothetical protein